MKKSFATFVLLAIFIQINAQLWLPGTPFPGASGVFIDGNTEQTNVGSLCEFNGELYVAGNFKSIGGLVAHSIAKWNGNNWSNVGQGNFLFTDVTDMVAYNGRLFFLAEQLYSWDGIQIQSFNYYGTDLHVFNNELYITSSWVNGLVKYNGTMFTEIFVDPFLTGTLFCIEDFNNSLYLGGSKGLFKLQNGAVINCNGITSSDPYIADIETFNGDLYATGSFNSIGGLSVSNFAKFNGNTWTHITFPNGISSSGGSKNSLNVQNNSLYYSGTFLAPNPLNNPSPVFKFDGNQWSKLATNSTNFGLCSIIYNNILYCGGAFSVITDGVGGIYYANGFIRLENTTGINDFNSTSYKISPNPTNDFITIELPETIEKTKYLISDKMGRTVQEGFLYNTSNLLDLASFSSGIYFLSIDGFNTTKQLIKY